MSTPEKPCRWNGASGDQTEPVYCEVGPDGHAGTHVGDRSRDEYYRRLREWRLFYTKEKGQVSNDNVPTDRTG